MALNLGQIFYTLNANVAGLIQATTGVNVFAASVARATQPTLTMVGGLRNLESAAVLAVGPLSGVGARIRSLGQLMGSTNLAFAGFAGGAVAGGFALYKLAQAAISANLRLSATRLTLELITGSSGVAGAEFNHLIDIANRSGISFGQVASEYAKFIASVKGTAIEGDAARKVFDELIMTAGTLHLTTDQVSLSFLALQQMMSKGNVQMQEVRQLQNQIPGAFDIIREAVGGSAEALNALIKSGKLVSAEVVPKIGAAIVKHFGIDMTGSVNTLQASLGRLDTAWLLFSDQMDKTLGISVTWQAFIEGMVSGLDSLRGNLTTIVPIIGAVTGALAGLFAPALISGVAALVRGVITLTGAMLGLTAATLANPFLALAGLLIRVAFAIAGAIIGFEALKRVMGDVGFDPLVKSIDDYIVATKRLGFASTELTTQMINDARSRVEAMKIELQALETNIQATVARSQLDWSQFFQFEQGKGFIKFFSDLWDGLTLDQKKEQAKALGDAIHDMAGRIAELLGLLAKPPSNKVGGGLDQTAAQARRLEKALFELNAEQIRLNAIQEGPLAIKMADDFLQAESAVESFREGLKQTGISQDELNAKVGEFRQIMFEKIKWEPITKGVQELQQIFTSTFSSISDTIAKTFVEGTKNIQDFVDIGKKLLEELISKLIEMLIFNNLFNALTGATGSAALPTITAAGLGQLFHAKGAILNKPTIVGKSGKKMDVGGEAGPEGLLPLARTSSGDLGVKAIGMGTSSPAQVFLDVNVYNESSKAKVETKQNNSGGLDVRVVDSMVAGAVGRRGSITDKALSQRKRLVPRGA